MRTALLFLLLAVAVRADDKPVLEHLKLKPPDTASQAIGDRLGETALRTRVGKQTITLWLRDEWPLKPKAADAAFRPGAFIGVISFTEPWTDFRGQELPAGAYTARYARQPASADHEDTSPFPDFWALSPVGVDRDPADLSFPALKKLSGQATGGTHPAVLASPSPGKREPGFFHPKESWLAVQWSWKTPGGERPVAAILTGVWTGK